MTLENIKHTIIPVLKKYRVKRAGIFGSYVKEKTSKTSDIDILVELGNEISLLGFVRIKLDLEDLLNKKVDLVEYQAIKPELRDRILAKEMRIYG